MRHVQIRNNLVVWLEAYPGEGADVPLASRFRRQFRPRQQIPVLQVFER